MTLTTPTLHLPYPESTDSADVPRDIKALADALDPLGIAPVGAMLMWPAASAPTDVNAAGRALWLLMIGQAVPAADYPKLATVLGQAGGNITIPDMRDRFAVGAGPVNPLASSGGVTTVALTARQSGIRAHAHGGKTEARDRSQVHGHSQQFYPRLSGPGPDTVSQPAAGFSLYSTTADDAPDHLHQIPWEADASALDAHENRPPYRAINFIIRAG